MKKIFLLLLFMPIILFSQINVADNAVTLGGTVGFHLNGTASQWNDLVFPATVSRINPTVSRPAYNYDSLALELIRDADSSDILYYSFQIPHSIAYGADVECSPHFHYIQQAAADTTFEVVLYYRIQEIGQPSGSWVRITPSKRAEFTFTSKPFHQVCEFQMIALNNITESSYIDFKLFRKDAAGNPATLWFKGFDVHFPFVSVGTPNEYPSH